MAAVPRYGGVSGYFVNSMCPRCEQSLDRHTIRSIFPSKTTDDLVDVIQASLDDVDRISIMKELPLPCPATMVGAAHADFGNSSSCDYITCSGMPGPGLLAIISHKRLAKKVVLIMDGSVAQRPGSSLYGIDGEIFDPTMMGRVTYPVGACAAQKLLTRISIDGKGRRGVTNIQMSEIMWRSSQMPRTAVGSRQWSSGHIARPCTTCMQVLPQMLCDKHS